MKKQYESPKILETSELVLEQEILKGSVIVSEESEVQSMGQEVVEVDLTEHKWE